MWRVYSFVQTTYLLHNYIKASTHYFQLLCTSHVLLQHARTNNVQEQVECLTFFCMFKAITAAQDLCVSLVFLSHLFPLPCGAGSTVPREGFDSSVIMPFSWCVVAVTLSI